MDMLRPWIAPYVHKVLTQAQQWSLQGSQLKARESYEDDGSNLRVKSEEKAYVQFTKVKASTAALSLTAQLTPYLD